MERMSIKSLGKIIKKVFVEDVSRVRDLSKINKAMSEKRPKLSIKCYSSTAYDLGFSDKTHTSNRIKKARKESCACSREKKILRKKYLPNSEELDIASITVTELNSLVARRDSSCFLVFREHQIDELAAVRGDQASALGGGDGTATR